MSLSFAPNALHAKETASRMWSSNTGDAGVEIAIRHRQRNEIRQTNADAHKAYDEYEKEQGNG